MEMGMNTGNHSVISRHMSNTAEHATPRVIVEAAREALGGRINLDPASTYPINRETVNAERVFTAEDDGLSQNWRGTVFVNPPGGCALVTERETGGVRRDICGHYREAGTPSCSCRLVQRFWEKLIGQYEAGVTHAAIWVGFSLEQLQVLQKCETSPNDYPICIPSKRLAYLKPHEDFAPGKSPPHSSYITYLGPKPFLFRAVFSQFGAVR